MKKRIVWLLLSCLMVAALLMASCGPAEEEEEVVVIPGEEEEVAPPEEEEVVTEEKGMVRDSLGRLVEKPRYGGVFIMPWSVDPVGFDEGLVSHVSVAPTLHYTNEELNCFAYEKGPSGTGEATWQYVMLAPPHLQAPLLAESWELVEPRTIVFHIRKGVHWHDKPPVNGRELTADDFLYTCERLWFDCPKSFNATSYPWDTLWESMEAPDKYTFQVTYKPGRAATAYEFISDHLKVTPPEVIEMYGDMGDWRNSCGTGPFMLIDYVTGSSVTFERNPNYWRTHPLHPEDTMPYVDGVKWLIIPDQSTRMAAMRTGKVDQLSLGWENAEEITRTSPELKHAKYLSGSAAALYMRVDKPELPIYDKRVRHALSMAINREEMIDTIYGGDADLLTWPTGNILELKDMYVPLDEMPDYVREQFEYNPEKAKQLLAEAGYPEGFQTEILCSSSAVDMLSIVKAYWEEIGVDLELLVREYAVYMGMGYAKRFDHMFYFIATGTLPTVYNRVKAGTIHNFSNVNDPVIEESYGALQDAFFDWDERVRLMREITPYQIDLAPMVQLPGAYSYRFWQPWVKCYSGELYLGYMNNYDFAIYIWLDQDLKEEMTGTR